MGRLRNIFKENICIFLSKRSVVQEDDYEATDFNRAVAGI